MKCNCTILDDARLYIEEAVASNFEGIDLVKFYTAACQLHQAVWEAVGKARAAALKRRDHV